MLKLKALAAAVTLVAAGSAGAAMQNFASGNGSLAFIALDYTGSPISMVMDLGYTIDSFAPAAGTTIVWDFNANTLSVNGVAQAGDFAWSGAFADFGAAAQTAETTWGVIAGDSVQNGTTLRYLSTSNTALATIQNQSKANLSQFGLVDTLINNNNLLPTHTTNADGASTASSGNAYVGNGASFGTAGKWQNKATFVALANEGVAQNFYMLDSNNGISSTKALVTPYDGTFNYSAGVLTYSVAPVPEPESYAMLLAGLGMIGAVVRRRTRRA